MSRREPSVKTSNLFLAFLMLLNCNFYISVAFLVSNVEFAARLEGWAEETFNGTGWRQAYYRRGQQVLPGMKQKILTFYRFINLC